MPYRHHPGLGSIDLDPANGPVGPAVERPAVELADQVAAFPSQLVQVVRILEEVRVLAMVTVAVIVVDGFCSLSAGMANFSANSAIVSAVMIAS